MTDNTATFDKLTGLPDLKGFQNCAFSLIKGIAPTEKPCILFFNIENFKLFNSTMGTGAGDSMIIFAAMAIQNAFPGEFTARIGDDHFAAITCTRDKEARIRRIHEQIRTYHPQLTMLLKAGIYEVQEYETDPILMLDNARLACESCKGRFDQVFAYYNYHLSESLLTNKYIVDHIDSAIRENNIRIFYQPLIRVQSGMMCGMEALARWEDPRYGLLSPDSFISVLEHAHLIHRLDLYIARKVCRDIQKEIEAGESVVPVSINLSRVDFDLCDMFQEIDSIVHSCGLEHELIDIEITESALSNATDALRNGLRKFREHGYRIWLDDFGSDYSSLNSLKDYDFDVLKIDMKFLSGLSDSGRSEKTKTIVRSVINMAKELGITALCEGVETERDLSFLQDAGCEIAQGYHFSRPIPLEQLKNLNLVWENREDARFSSIVGSVNLLSTDPLRHIEGADMDIGFQPMALFEYGPEHCRTLIMNAAFRKFLATLQFGSMDELDLFFNNRSNRLTERMLRAADKTIGSRSTESVDLVLNGDYCNLQMACIATNRNSKKSVILVRAMNVSRTSSYVAGGIKDKVLRSVYALFERIDILDIDNDRIMTVHESRGRFRGRYDDLSLQEGIIEFAQLNIHPEDQDRFIQLYTISSLMELLQKSRHSFHSSLFRIHEGDGVYVWQLCIQSMVRLDGRQVILSMLCDNEETANEIANYLYESARMSTEAPEKSSEDPVDSAIPKSALFDSLIQAVPYGVFWKDKNRRFLGANRFFLDFYGFSSTSVIIGNTDEDMGWHVDPVPFMRDEYDVLKGKLIFDAAGSCIVRGIDHQIKASKFPVYKNGSIVGLIGMFKDLGPNIEDPNASIDELTGLLNSRGAIETFNRYEKSYREKKIDFCIISIDINSFSEYNHLYGAQAANDLLKKVGQVLAAIMGESGVVSRIGGDEFVILHQISDRSQIDQYEYEIASAVSTIQSIQGIPVTVNITTESILFSESPSARVRAAEETHK